MAARPRQHNRSAVEVTTGSQAGQVRAPTVVNRGVLPEEKEAERRASARTAKAARTLTELEENFSDVPVDYVPKNDNRFLPASLREEQAEKNKQNKKEVVWDERFMPERLRRLLAEEKVTPSAAGGGPSIPDSEFRIYTREDLERAQAGLPVIEVPTETDFVPAFPEPPGSPPDNGGGDSGGSGGDFSHLPPPPSNAVTSNRKSIGQILNTAALSFVGAFAGMQAVTIGSAVANTGVTSSTIIAGIAAGAAVPFAMSTVRESRFIKGRKSRGLSPEWQNFQTNSGWEPKQCKRWQKAGFSAAEAAQWENEFRTRPGLDLGVYPLGGDGSVVKMAKAYRNMAGVGNERLSPQDASEFIQAYVTPKAVSEWTDKYLEPNASEAEREVFRDFILTAHGRMNERMGPGYKSVDSSMKSLCKELGIPELQRWDRNDDSVMERYSRDVKSSRGRFADAVILD